MRLVAQDGALNAPLATADGVPPQDRLARTPPDWSMVALAVGAGVLAFPTMKFVADTSWSTEQGAHGPIVLATGLWLLWRLARESWHLARPAPILPVVLMLAALLPLFVMARVTQIVEIEGYVMYAVLLVALYSVVGGRMMRALWFPLFYMVFMFPPPDTLIAAVTLPMKIGVSQTAVGLLSAVGYPIGGSGVMIQIGQYQLLVAAACAGLNSIISLSAISLFYIYVRHQANWRYALLLSLFIVPVALIANLIRVLILILLTYHAGEATAQGFLHEFAGLTMFAAALLTVIGFDLVLEPLWRRFGGRSGSAPA